ncbi:hypothetical protein [Bacillus sp. JCM 19034]|uniref:hypothetical protein n=1 Tax=Bacillus sp. JCM 19034 TaxID=1481928 RepID=UPI0007825CE0|nr:hypothetical protein [Bacillus sp. JCM 19034]
MKKRKRWLLLAGAAGTVTWLLTNEQLRLKVKKNSGQVKNIFRKSVVSNKVQMQKIGHSHPYDYEDNNMVDEGAMTSIHYFNRAQQKDHQ